MLGALNLSKIFSVAVLWIVIALLPLSTLLSGANQHFYDLLLSQGLLDKHARQSPLMVSVGEQPDWLKLFDQLAKGEVARVFILKPIERQLAWSLPKDLPVDVELVPSLLDSQHLATYRSETNKPQKQHRSPPSFHLPPQRYVGVQRLVPREAKINNQTIIHYAYDHWPEGHKSIQLNFQLLNSAAVTLSESQVISGQAIPELVKGRTVLIALAGEFGQPGYFVPNGERALNRLEMEALFWTTLLNKAWVEHLTVTLALLMVVLIAFIVLFSSKWLSPKQSLLLVAVLIALLLVVSGLAMHFGSLILPFWESIAAICFMFFAALQSRYTEEDALIGRMLADAKSVLAERVSPVAFDESEDPWARIVVFISQQLRLEKSIFFERITGDHRLQEIQSMNCTLDDILERRRDFERSPYSDAIAQQAPILLTKQFFKTKTEDEKEFVVPLMFGNQVLGFWALTTLSKAGRNFERTLKEFSEQIAELLFHRQNKREAERSDDTWWQHFLEFGEGRQHIEHLADAMLLIEKRLDTYEEVFSGLSSASVLYDLFGQVLQINEKMDTLAKKASISLFNMSLLDLLMNLCELSKDESRDFLRHVALKKTPIYLPIKTIEKSKSYMLYLRPITQSDNQSNSQFKRQQRNPFHLLGILFEFVDVTTVQDSLENTADIYGHFFHAIRNHMNRVTFASKKISKKVEGQESSLLAIDQAVSESVTMIDALETKIWNRIESRELHASGPVSLIRIVNNALDALDSAIEEKYLRCEKDLPFTVSLICANGESLRLSLENILALLVQDASVKTPLYIELTEFPEPEAAVVLTLRNEGFGMPEKELQTRRTEELDPDKSDLLGKALSTLSIYEHWGGRAKVQTKAGEGFTFELTFTIHELEKALPKK